MTRTRCALLWMLLLALLKAPTDALLTNLLPDAAVINAAAGALMSLLLLGIPAWLLRPWRSVRLLQRRSLGEGILVGAAAAVLARQAFAPADAAWQGWFAISTEVIPLPEGLSAAYVLLAAVVPSILEEIFFRGALLTGLLDGSRRGTAAVLTVFSFALMHGSAADLPGHLGISAVLTLHTGRVAVPVAAHLVYNLLAFVPLRLPLWGSCACGAALVLLAGWMCIRQPKIAHPPMKGLDVLLACTALAVLAALYLI